MRQITQIQSQLGPNFEEIPGSRGLGFQRDATLNEIERFDAMKLKKEEDYGIVDNETKNKMNKLGLGKGDGT